MEKQTNQDASKARRALKGAFTGLKVTNEHEWLRITADIHSLPSCTCTPGGKVCGSCRRISNDADKYIVQTVQSATGRYGQYDGRITTIIHIIREFEESN